VGPAIINVRPDAGSRTDFRTTLSKRYCWIWFQGRDFKFCFTWYPTDITLCGVDSFIPVLEHLIEKLVHGLFSKKKPLKSCSMKNVHEMKLIPSAQCYLFLILIYFFHVEAHKVSTSIWGGSHVLLHKPWHWQEHSARSSCTAPERVRKRSESGWK